MKKFALILLALLIGALLASCGEPTPTPTPEPAPEPVVRGDMAVIFAKSIAFDIVYSADDETAGEALASELSTEIEALELMKPKTFADSGKTETKCELLLGDTDRALSVSAKAKIADNVTADPEGSHWVFVYSGGQLALVANSAEAYALAIAELCDEYFSAGEVTVKTDLSAIGNVPSTKPEPAPEPEPEPEPEPPHEAYMEYKKYDNFYDGYTDPFGMKEEDYKEMLVTRHNDYTIHIDYILSDTTYYRVVLTKKAWGMWMLADIMYRENGKNHVICPGNTDYEFVLSCGNETENTFRSGNHADYELGNVQLSDTTTYNDMLLDITFYDGKTGDEINIKKKGYWAKVNGLRVVLHHNIYEQNYAQENVLMNSERSYLFNGFDVLLDTNLYMTQDVNFGTSYSCMLPIEKLYGNCAILYNMDGTTTYAKTHPMGYGSEYNITVWNFKSTKVELWGENNPEYHMTVEILNPDGQFFGYTENESYVSIRDMRGGGTNKIYFSFATAGATLKHGEKLHFVNKWSFAKIEGFKNPDREVDVPVMIPR